MNMANENEKPKWTIIYGLGPKKMELDKSKSGRIYSPSIKQFGLNSESNLIKEKVLPKEIRFICNTTMTSLQKVKKEELNEFIIKIFENKPLYINYEKCSDFIESNLNWDEFKNLKLE
jgi:hypothetical protein